MTELRRSERGQALILMAFVFIGLLAMVGLAIDGGSVFLDRRRMQNAADAAALAGTRELAKAMCDDEAAGTADAAVYAAVIDYARHNGVDVDDPANSVEAQYVDFNQGVLGPVGGGAVPNGAAGVLATAAISHPTYFVTLVGQHTAGSSADAVALTGPPLVAGGLRPFGIPLEVVLAVEPGQGEDSCFTLSFASHCDDDDDCIIEYLDGRTSSHRGWMNLCFVWNQGEYSDWPRALDNSVGAGGGGCKDGAGMKDWMAAGWNGVLYADCPWSSGCRYGDFIDAKPGTTGSMFDNVPRDELFYVPIFDEFPDCPGRGDPEDIESPYPDNAHPGPNGDEACKGGQNPSYYHIVGFAGVKVPVDGVNKSAKTIEACLQETIIGQGEPSPNPGYGTDVCATHTMVISLQR
jgi:hypothetical protein